MLRILNKICIRQSNLLKTSIAPRNAINRLYSTKEIFVNEYKSAFLSTSIVGITGYLLFKEYLCEASCETKSGSKRVPMRHEVVREDLPFFTPEEVALHVNKYYRKINFPGVDNFYKDASTFDVIGNACETERENSVWISYGVGVYDITNLINKHGTPETTILLAAGMNLNIFWDDEDMKKIHDKPYIYDMLEKCRVGNIHKVDASEIKL
ncbi:hypothetical protein PVAND_014161 [Polypedilum vanderplanki]|uniref:Cytochrome b5 heme-binding domain-containing protein n=1 Tax=Polypedilum vanderplanki TaxID=319348 RepID=A0A9J6CRH7_POLVA|nr:hypothetical protein PVAND_014161 [Polypedilum vanderplanki]